MLADGTVERPPDLDALRPRLARCQADGIEAVAIAFLHGHRHPAHEQAVADLCREMGLAWVFPSHAVERVSGVVSRAETTVADAYLTPLLRHHVDGVTATLGDVPLEFMQSNGGLVRAAAFSGRNAVLSGPAGGIIGAATVGGAAGHDRLVSFDMGGTSTDVAHWDRDLERTTEIEIAGTTLRTPMLRVHTVAAGGGSVCRVEFGRLRVGPQSAGAEPGPACYGRGGPAAVTDCNLVLGRLLPEAMPQLFEPARYVPPPWTWNPPGRSWNACTGRLGTCHPTSSDSLPTSSPLSTNTWSRRSRCSVAMRRWRSGGRAASMPESWRRLLRRWSCIRWLGCCRRWGWASPPCVRSASA